MRFFTDSAGNFNWAAIGALCAVVGSVLAVASFFMTRPSADVSAKNIETVIGDYVAGDKIEGITLEQYEAGLKRRESEVSARLNDETLSAADAKAMRDVLRRIDKRQADLQGSYADVAKLTAEIRAYHENIEDKDLIREAVLDIFDGNSAGAVDKVLEAGIPLETVATIESTSRVFQQVRTEPDFQKFVVGRDLALSNDANYVRSYGANGSMSGAHFGRRTGVGSWAFVAGAYCEEFTHEGTHYPQYCPKVFVTKSAVKFEYQNGDTAIYSIRP